MLLIAAVVIGVLASPSAAASLEKVPFQGRRNGDSTRTKNPRFNIGTIPTSGHNVPFPSLTGKPAALPTPTLTTTSQVVAKPTLDSSSWDMGWLFNLFPTNWGWNNILPDKNGLLGSGDVLGLGGDKLDLLGGLGGNKVELLGGNGGLGQGLFAGKPTLPSLPTLGGAGGFGGLPTLGGLAKPDLLGGAAGGVGIDDGITNEGVFIGKPEGLLPGLPALPGLPGLPTLPGLGLPGLGGLKPDLRPIPTTVRPSTSEVMVITYPEFIRTIGQGIKTVSDAMTEFGLTVTNSITDKLSTGILGAGTTALGSGVASIIPLEDKLPDTNHNKGTGAASVIGDASSLGNGLFIPNKLAEIENIIPNLGNKVTNPLGGILGPLGNKPALGGNTIPNLAGHSTVYVDKVRK